MDPDIITEAFNAFLSQKQITPDQLSPAQSLDTMAEFLKEVKFDWIEDHQDADMLLFQYGVYDWGEGENFELNVTRQLMRAHGDDEDDDDNIFQLALTLFYPARSYEDIESFGRWSTDSSTVNEYLDEMKSTEGFQRASRDVPTKVEIWTDTV